MNCRICLGRVDLRARRASTVPGTKIGQGENQCLDDSKKRGRKQVTLSPTMRGAFLRM